MPSAVHYALHEVVALHAILVGGAVGEVGEGGGAERVLFELPEVSQQQAHFVANRPVVVIPFYGIGQRTALGVALDASIVGLDVVHVGGIEDVGAGGIRGVLATGAVAALTAYVPLGDLLCADVVIDGVAAVAGGTGGALKIIRRVQSGPPVGAGSATKYGRQTWLVMSHWAGCGK